MIAEKSPIVRDFYAAWDAAITDVSAMRVGNAHEATDDDYRAMIAKLRRISLIAKS